MTGLPTAENPAGRWWADVGLGEGFRLPLPLVEGEHVQDGFRYRLTDVGPRRLVLPARPGGLVPWGRGRRR